MSLHELNAKLVTDGLNTNVRCTVLIKAFLAAEGASSGDDIRKTMSLLGFKDGHVRVILNEVLKDKFATLRWTKNADNLYVDVD